MNTLARQTRHAQQDNPSTPDNPPAKATAAHQRASSVRIGLKLSRALFAFASGLLLWWLYCAVSYFGSIIPADDSDNALTGVTAIALIVLAGCCTAIILSASARRRFKAVIHYLLGHHRQVFIAMLCWQAVIFLCLIPTYTRWDPTGAISGTIKAAMTPNGFDQYLSHYPNNAFLFTLEFIPAKILIVAAGGHLKSNVLHAALMLFMQLINVAAIDCAIVLLRRIMIGISSRAAGYAFLMMALLLGCSVWIMVPYTDTLSLLPSLWLIALIIKAIQAKTQEDRTATPQSRAVRLSSMGRFIVIGVASAFAYAMKPSTVIPLIAFIIIWLLLNLGRRIFTVWLPTMLAIAIGFMAVTLPLNSVEHKAFNFDASQAVPMTHFMMMGMQGHGGYNQEDVDATLARATSHEKTEYNLSVIGNRLSAYGIDGYLAFLMKKSYYNTAQGELGFSQSSNGVPATVTDEGNKGTVILAVGVDNNPATKYHILPLIWIQDLLLSNGSVHGIYMLVMQIIYVIVISGIAVFVVAQYRRRNDLTEAAVPAWLVLSILGGYTFLLLFEGGRSRYLIQYLPLMLIASALGWVALREKIHARHTLQVLHIEAKALPAAPTLGPRREA